MSDLTDAMSIHLEVQEAARLKERGFVLGKLDSNNEHVCRQWVKVNGIPGCGLLNSIFIRRPEDNTFPLKGSVQYGNKNNYRSLHEIRPAKWWEFFFQPHGFGQIAWWQMGLIAVGCAGLWLAGAWYCTPVIAVLIIAMTFTNFKRSIV